MSKPTKSDQIVAALLTLGAREVLPSPSKRYRCFERAEGLRYWVGRCGALRFGRTVSASQASNVEIVLRRAAVQRENSARPRPIDHAGQCACATCTDPAQAATADRRENG